MRLVFVALRKTEPEHVALHVVLIEQFKCTRSPPTRVCVCVCTDLETVSKVAPISWPICPSAI